MLTGDVVADLLGLVPLPREGGMWAQTWLDEDGSGIYFLMTPGSFSALHRLDRPELWHHYAGAPVNMLLLGPDPGRTSTFLLGDDLVAGQRPFYGVAPGVWMGARSAGDWSLVGTTMAPPYHEDGFELGVRDELAELFPNATEAIYSYLPRKPDDA